jgi:hypothetical protein
MLTMVVSLLDLIRQRNWPSDPRQEPGLVVQIAGLRAGGGQPSYLPRQSYVLSSQSLDRRMTVKPITSFSVICKCRLKPSALFEIV